jgi:hypothetical protein
LSAAFSIVCVILQHELGNVYISYVFPVALTYRSSSHPLAAIPEAAPSPTQALANATLEGFHAPIQDLVVQLEELEYVSRSQNVSGVDPNRHNYPRRGQQGWINTLTQEQQTIINMDKDFAEVIGLVRFLGIENNSIRSGRQ